MPALKKATTIRDAWRACDLTPLSGDRLQWWADLADARGARATTRLETFLDLREPGQWLHVAFTGHRGCGKSTELLRLKDRWADDYFVVYFEVTDLLDPNDVAFSDLFLTIAMVVAQRCHEAKMPLRPKLLKSVESFAATVIKETANITDAQLEANAQAAAGLDIPFVAKLKAWVTSQYKAATHHKETIRRVFERDITRLITDTNLLLDDARRKLTSAQSRQSRGPSDLLIVIDNLDRLPPEVADRLVFQHGDFLKQLRANIIYTVPVSVLHSRKGIDRVFPCHDVLPMIRVYRHNRRKLHLDWDEAAIDAMVGALRLRIDVEEVFETEEMVRELARGSGGCIRHFMQFARYACETAHAHGRGKVSDGDVEDAVKRMPFDFERMIPDEHYSLFCEVARTKRVPNSDMGRDALFNLSVLEYNGAKRWNYVHPLVRQIDRFTEELRGKAKGTKKKA